MTQSSKTPQEILPDQMPFSAEEWAQTPVPVQRFVLSLLARVQSLEATVSALREQVNRNSRNSSRPLPVMVPRRRLGQANKARVGANLEGSRGTQAHIENWFPSSRSKQSMRSSQPHVVIVGAL